MSLLSNLNQSIKNVSKQQLMHFAVLGIVLLLVGASYFWLLSKFEKVQTVKNLGYKKEAFLNPYLAGQTFLEETGIKTDTTVDIEIILDSVSNDDTVVLLNKRRFHPVQTKKIMEWLSNGGHLIMTPSSLWDTETETSDDEFLNQFGVQFHEWETDVEEWEGEVSDIIENYTDQILAENVDDIEENLSSENDTENVAETVDEGNPALESNANGEDESALNTDTEETSQETSACTPYDQETPSYIAYDNNGNTISINFRNRYHLTDSSGNALYAEELEDNDSANHILQYPVGEGMLTVLSDQRFWKNQQISWYDHSYLLWMLTSDSETAWFVFDTDSPNVIELLWVTAKYLIICLGFGLILVLWQQGKRFGPTIPDASFNRRQLVEHIEASTRFSWNHKQFENNMAVLLQDIRQQLRITHNIIFDELSDVHNTPDLVKKISQITQMDEKSVQSAFVPSFEYKENAFVQRIQLLQQLRNRL